MPPELVRQSAFFIFVGALSTIADWASFCWFNSTMQIDYRLAVTISFIIGASINYTLNKTLTFCDKTKQIAAQLSIYIVIAIVVLLSSVLFMFIEVRFLKLTPTTARAITTGFMMVINFIIHKFITFNHKIYRKTSRAK